MVTATPLPLTHYHSTSITFFLHFFSTKVRHTSTHQCEEIYMYVYINGLRNLRLRPNRHRKCIFRQSAAAVRPWRACWSANDGSNEGESARNGAEKAVNLGENTNIRRMYVCSMHVICMYVDVCLFVQHARRQSS